MKYVINSVDSIDMRSLCAFYTHAILPQFGISRTEITWYGIEEWMPGDEVMLRFETGGEHYVLIFEDYHSAGWEQSDKYDMFMRDKILGEGQTYEFVYPKSRKPSDPNPTYDGFHLTGYALYCPYITGTYTLHRIIGSLTSGQFLRRAGPWLV